MIPLALVTVHCLTALVGSSLLTGEYLSVSRTADLLSQAPVDVALVNLSDSLFFHEWKLWAQKTPGADANPVLSNQRVVGMPLHMHPFGEWVQEASLRVGRPGTGTKAHRDNSDTLVVIVSGKKSVKVWQANATSEEEHILSEGEAIFLPAKVLHQTRDLAANVVSAVFRGGESVAELALTAFECRTLNNGVPGCFKQPWESALSPCTYCKCELAPSFEECPALGFTGYFVPSEPAECQGLFKFPSGNSPSQSVSVSESPSPVSSSPSPSPFSPSPSPAASPSPVSDGSNNGLYGLFALFAIPLLLLPLCGLAYWLWSRPAPVPFVPEYVQPVQMVQQPVQYVQQPQFFVEEFPKHPPSPVHYVQQPMQFMQAAPMQVLQSATPVFGAPMAFA